MKMRPLKHHTFALVFTATALLVASAFWHCSNRTSGRQSPNATTSPAVFPTHRNAPVVARRTVPRSGNGWALTYAFSFPTRSGNVEILADGQMLKIEEIWDGGEAHASNWGTKRARLIFDGNQQTLTIVNLTQNTYTLITEEKLDEARKTMATRRSAGPPADDAPSARVFAEAPGPESVTEKPRPVDRSVKAHLGDCAVYKRALPSGLEEESCYRTWKAAGIAPRALDALLALRIYIREVDRAVPELAVVTQVAEALTWDLGMVVSQFTFGVSPLDPDEPSDKPAPWDKSFKLKEARPYSYQSADFAIPTAAIKSDELLPWRAPFLYL